MAKIVTDKCTKEKPAVRAGRPPRGRAGEVDTRILDAADRVFLKQGFAGATIDEIARLAPASKPTIYDRFPNKETLFTAVLTRQVDAYVARFKTYTAPGATVNERLTRLGTAILHGVLVEDAVGLSRLAIAEAQRFPHLASTIDKIPRVRLAEALAGLFGELAESDELGASADFAPERRAGTALLFFDLILLPLLIRALFGEKLEVLHAEIGPHVAKSVSFFLRACGERELKVRHDHRDSK